MTNVRWKPILISIAVVAIVLVSGCTEESVTSLSTPTPTKTPSRPVRIADLVTYTDNMDSDAADELVAYIILKDTAGEMVAADGKLHVKLEVKKYYTYASGSYYTTAHTSTRNVGSDDFIRTIAGRGAYEREILAYIWYINSWQLDRRGDSDYGRLTVTFEPKYGSNMSAKDDYARLPG